MILTESCRAGSFFEILGDFNASSDWLEHQVNHCGFMDYPCMSQYVLFLKKMRVIQVMINFRSMLNTNGKILRSKTKYS